MTPRQRVDHLYEVISSRRFLAMEGLNNEIPFFICPYAPDQAFDMANDVRGLKRRLSNAGIKILMLDLYDLSLELLREREVLDAIIEGETGYEKSELKELLQGVLDPAKHLIPRMAALMASTDHQVIFMTGVGEVYPFIRSHNVLNNLQSAAKHCPTVLFYPGEFTHQLDGSASLDLFGKLHEDKYYRATNILHYEV
ncbi:hypothetical protein ATY76_14290 [Rhizobium sp. R339]|nr:hypothetical protein ATY76_14290 [Rhizobium sp. R339]